MTPRAQHLLLRAWCKAASDYAASLLTSRHLDWRALGTLHSRHLLEGYHLVLIITEPPPHQGAGELELTALGLHSVAGLIQAELDRLEAP